MRKTFLLGLALVGTLATNAQTGSIGIGTSNPEPSAKLEISSNDKGFLPPRMTQTQRDNITNPVAGLAIYNTSAGKLNVYNGTAWTEGLNTTEQVIQTPLGVSFSFTGGAQTYTVPAGVTHLTVTAKGAQGGAGINNTAGGLGAQVTAIITVTPGEVLNIYVGGAGTTVTSSNGYSSPNNAGGFNGGGGGKAAQAGHNSGSGGGASDVRRGGTAYGNRVLVAGGGGGTSDNAGSAGGAPNGGSSGDGAVTGGTQTAGGISINAFYPNSNIPSGTLGQGGSVSVSNITSGGGGGGGGYYGGGATMVNNANSGGGGGSSWVIPGSFGVSMTAGANAGNGVVTIVSGAAYPAPVLLGSNFVGSLPALDGSALTNLTETDPKVGTLTNGYLPYWNGTTSKLENTTLYNGNGSVGVGKTNPATALDVAGTITATSPAGNGINGTTNSTNNTVAGVKGSATVGINSTGVLGVTAKGYGVRGMASDSGAYAVSGEIAATTGNGSGIYGSGSGTSYAGLFNGKVQVNGNLAKLGGSFKIDHPLDPANKYLYHSFVESSDMMNIYNGNAILDAQGEAVVQLPDWFEALNRDFRYQLTSLSTFMPVFIKEKVNNNRFSVGGGTPGGEVSWQVTGIRHDKYAEAHRIPVEEPKAAEDRGRYLAPDVYGQPLSEGIGRKRDSQPAVVQPEKK